MISRRSRKALLICAAICIVFIPLVSVRASKTTFYPDECIGDWKELKNAEGKIDVRPVTEITSGDAAESDRVGSRIVCSHFSDTSLSHLRPTSAELVLSVRSIGVVSPDTTISRLFKKYSTTVFAEEVISASSTETIPPLSASSSIPEVVEELGTTTVSDISTSTPTSTETINSTQPSNPEVDASSTIPTTESTTTSSQTSTTSEFIEPIATSTDGESVNNVSSTTVQEIVPSSNSEIEVQVSFDEGVSWIFVGNSIVSGVDPISLTLPLYPFKTGEDVSKLSVRIIKTAGSPEVLLDGMSLSVSFVPLTENDRAVVLADTLEKNPDFSAEIITGMVNALQFQALTTKKADGTSSLWIYDESPSGTSTPFLIATGPLFTDSAQIASKDGIVFWLNGVDELYGFRVRDHRILIPLSKRERDSGEREFIFSESPWKVVLRGGLIQFFSTDSGEVGGDDDGSLRQVFYDRRLSQQFSDEGKSLMSNFGIDTGVVTE